MCRTRLSRADEPIVSSDSMADSTTSTAGHARPRYRVPIGMPMRDEGRRAGAVVSVVVHALIIFLLIVPFFMPRSVIERAAAGRRRAGAGRRRGRRHAGHWRRRRREHIQFVQVLPRAGPDAEDAAAGPAAMPKPVVQGRAAEAGAADAHAGRVPPVPKAQTGGAGRRSRSRPR